jgi:hypothetical protein
MTDKSTFDKQVEDATEKYYNRVFGACNDDLRVIANALAKSAATAEINATWGDIRNADPGKCIREYNMFLAGYNFAKGGAMIDQYSWIIKEHRLKADAEYAEYQRLKTKFEG